MKKTITRSDAIVLVWFFLLATDQLTPFCLWSSLVVFDFCCFYCDYLDEKSVE